MNRALLACVAVLVSGGCDRLLPEGVANASTPAASVELVPAAEAAPATRPSDGDRPLDETDRLMLEQARIACRNTDDRALFDTIIRSPAVRLAYSAPQIRLTYWSGPRAVAARTILRADYDEFPIVFEDQYRKPAAAIDPNEHIVLEFNQAADESVAVDWMRVIYDGRTEGGDDLGRARLLDGRAYDGGLAAPDGRLLFRATTTCWELTADERFVPE